MLSCNELSVDAGPKGPRILDRATAQFKSRGLNAIIGPSGCGKTTLVKAMLGILKSEGEVLFDGERIRSSADLLGQLSFAPQFSIAHGGLTVDEAIRYALELTVTDVPVRVARLEEILGCVGLEAHREKRVNDLSGGQLRRLGLGLELVSDPPCMVCDEVTSGLDPRSEDDILRVLERLRDEQGKTFICIIHNLAKLDFFDRISVIYEGGVVFQGTLDELNAYFGIPDALQLYDRLGEESIEYWRSRWSDAQKPGVEQAGQVGHEIPRMPGLLAQIVTLLKRRTVLFRRDKGYWLLTLGITLGFPLLVVIFALDGIPQLQGMSLDSNAGFLEQMQDSIRFRIDALETASLVTGLILFQVILLTLMGSNNGAREIAGERQLYEKERFSGLNPIAYGLSKLIFASGVALLQGLWMTLFVKYICQFPGALLAQSIVLMLSCVSMTAVCLGFSAIFSSADKASLLSVYLVGFQLPLSGIVLALPELLIWTCRPFINAYWGWAGYFGSMRETRVYDAYRLESAEWIPSPSLAVFVLLLQFCVGALMVFLGCQKKSWN
ncbi:MAG: ABC transporter ATP-binding protein/permease [Verrucomicrobiota bacterium]